MVTLDQALDTVIQLPFDQQAMLLDIIQRRHIASRRHEIISDAQLSITAFQRGELNVQPLTAIIAELRQTLNETSVE